MFRVLPSSLFSLFWTLMQPQDVLGIRYFSHFILGDGAQPETRSNTESWIERGQPWPEHWKSKNFSYQVVAEGAEALASHWTEFYFCVSSSSCVIRGKVINISIGSLLAGQYWQFPVRALLELRIKYRRVLAQHIACGRVYHDYHHSVFGECVFSRRYNIRTQEISLLKKKKNPN